jgi:predicted transcriptional regulator/outer membrane protein assembly factor BamB
VYWDGLYRAETGEYADFREPGSILAAYDKNGNPLWSKDTGVSAVRQYFSAGASDTFHTMPLYDHGKLYVPTDSGISALDRSGQVTWSKQLGDSNYRLLSVMPVDRQGNLYFRRDNGDSTRTIRSIDNEGKDRSSFVYRAPPISWLSGSNGVLYEAARSVADKSSTMDLDTMRIGAIDAQSGRYLWNYSVPIIGMTTTAVNRSNADTFFEYGISEAQMGPDPGPTIYGFAFVDIVPADSNVYVSFKSVSYEYPIEFDRSNATYARALYALDGDGNLVWQHPLDSYDAAWAANNTTVFYAGDDGKINVAAIGLAAAGGIALLASAYLALKYFLFGTVTRARSRLEDNDNRKQIMQSIVASPGATQYEITRQTGINMGTVRYHLLILGMNHKIRIFKEGKYVRYFPNSNLYSGEEQLIIALMRRDPINGILRALLENPGLTYADLVKIFGLSDVAISDHMKNLVEKGVTIKVKMPDGRLAFTIRQDYVAVIERLRTRNIIKSER